MMNSDGRGNKGPSRFVFCRECKHFYITWDKRFPYGCRALGFKSRGLPAADVRASSGMPCMAFSRKEKGGGGKDRKSGPGPEV